MVKKTKGTQRERERVRNKNKNWYHIEQHLQALPAQRFDSHHLRAQQTFYSIQGCHQKLRNSERQQMPRTSMHVPARLSI